MRATIICPTYNHGRLLECAMRSVLAQTHEDFEVFVIGDGVTSGTRVAVHEVLEWDSRIEFVDRVKSARHGEEYRHEILCGRATGEAVFYIGDDDIWLPGHLESLLAVLECNDVAHSMHVVAKRKGGVAVNDVDWAEKHWREWTIQPPRNNGVALSQVGHRMDFYRRLPHGWRTTPEGEWSDHYMWKQMLAVPGVRAAGSGRRTALQFPSPVRLKMTEDERFAEISEWLDGALHSSKWVERYFDLQASHSKLERELAGLNDRHAVETIHREWGESLEKKRRRIAVLKERESDLKQKHAGLRKLVDEYRNLPSWYRRVGKWLGFRP